MGEQTHLCQQEMLLLPLFLVGRWPLMAIPTRPHAYPSCACHMSPATSIGPNTSKSPRTLVKHCPCTKPHMKLSMRIIWSHPHNHLKPHEHVHLSPNGYGLNCVCVPSASPPGHTSPAASGPMCLVHCCNARLGTVSGSEQVPSIQVWNE